MILNLKAKPKRQDRHQHRRQGELLDNIRAFTLGLSVQRS
jgi:hypothetical protein